MPQIHLTTFIAAPTERVFHLSRSIDLHKQSMQAYNERPVAGTITGLIGLHETVTWQARHLFRERRLQVKITALEAPHSFTDEQVSGDFKSMRHEHHFKPCENGTLMIDRLFFETPYGLLGRLVNKVWLSGYLEKMLRERNEWIRKTAESNLWIQYLPA